MAKNQEIMEINLRKNTNASSKGYGKYYGLVEFKGTLTTRALAEHMASQSRCLTWPRRRATAITVPWD